MVIDQGCGTGSIAIAVARGLLGQTPQQVVATDTSIQGVISAVHNVQATNLDGLVTVEHTDTLTGLPAAELIICNPPFHQEFTVTDTIAMWMFEHAHHNLAVNGHYVVVGNRHLRYHTVLRRLFGNCVVLGESNRFVVLHATKNRRV